MTKGQLTRLVVVFETEAAAAERLVRHGYASEVAHEIAIYLAQATDLPDHMDEIRAALDAEEIAVDFVALDALAELLPALDRDRTILWSQTDGIRFYRGSAVPVLARLAGIARYGSPPTTQHLCQDKFASLAVARSAGVLVPPTLLLEGGEEIAALGDPARAGQALFVKPATLGAKIGIWADSRCRGLDDAKTLSMRIRDRYGDRAVVQPFVEGDDVRVSFMDTGGAFADQLGIFRLAKNAAGETGGAFMTMRDNETLSGAKDTAGGRGGFGQTRKAAFVPQMIDLKTESGEGAARAVTAISDGVRRLARLLPLQDYFSMDFRIDAAGQPTLFEFETCPAVTIYDFADYLRTVQGLSLGQALSRSLRLAHARRRSRGEA